MTKLNDAVPPPRPVLHRFLAAYRGPAWMQARVVFNAYRILLGVLLLASVPWIGPLALIGIVPIAWAVVSYSWMYRVQHAPTARN
jgi:hypothetical protein